MRRNPDAIVSAFLVACSPMLALGGPNKQEVGTPPSPQQQLVRPPITQDIIRQPQQQVPDQAWWSKQSNALLDVIKILYKGRDADLKELETSQARLTPQDQIERRIALIKATLSAKDANPSQ